MKAGEARISAWRIGQLEDGPARRLKIGLQWCFLVPVQVDRMSTGVSASILQPSTMAGLNSNPSQNKCLTAGVWKTMKVIGGNPQFNIFRLLAVMQLKINMGMFVFLFCCTACEQK